MKNNQQQLPSNKVRILFTEACPRKCFFCHNEGQNKGRAFIEVETVKNFLDGIDVKSSRIIISGGEPTIHKRLFHILELVRSYEPLSLELVTAASRPFNLSGCLPLLDKVKLHVDSYQSGIHEKVGGDKIDNFLISTQILSEWVKQGGKVITETPLTHLYEAGPIIDESIRLGFTQSKFLQVRPMNPMEVYPTVWDVYLALKSRAFNQVNGSETRTDWLNKDGYLVTCSSLPATDKEESIFLHASGLVTNGLNQEVRV